MHRSLTLTVAFLPLAVRKLKSLTNWYWFLTNLPGQWPPWGAPRGWGAKAEPAKTSVTGGGHGKDSSQGIGLVGRSRRIRAESGQEPVRPYRPEQHYMRGPGPKWHAKHDRASVSYRAIPVLVPVR